MTEPRQDQGSIQALIKKWRRQSRGEEAPWSANSRYVYGLCADELEGEAAALSPRCPHDCRPCQLKDQLAASERAILAHEAKREAAALDASPYHPFANCQQGCGFESGKMVFCEKHQPELLGEGSVPLDASLTSKKKDEEGSTRMDKQADSSGAATAPTAIIYYGPHACEKCGETIVKASRDQGGWEFNYPDGPIYPNTVWQSHVHRNNDVAVSGSQGEGDSLSALAPLPDTAAALHGDGPTDEVYRDAAQAQRERAETAEVKVAALSPLTDWMSAETTHDRDAAFLRMYAAKVRDRSAVSWEIPNTVATTLEDIAKRIQREGSVPLDASLTSKEDDVTRSVEPVTLPASVSTRPPTEVIR